MRYGPFMLNFTECVELTVQRIMILSACKLANICVNFILYDEGFLGLKILNVET